MKNHEIHQLLYNIQQTNVRAADYIGLSIKSISRIRKKGFKFAEEDKNIKENGKNISLF